MTYNNVPLNDLSPTAREAIERAEAQIAAYPESEVTDIPKDGDYDHRLTVAGLLDAQVCTRLTATEAAEWLTMVRPPGTSYNQWEPDLSIAEVPCEQFPTTHRHVIVNC